MAHRTLSPTHRVLGALVSPVRQDVLELLESAAPQSAADLARRLGKRPDTLYHHLRALERAGLVRAEGRPSTGGRPGRVWRPVTPTVRVRSTGLTRAGARRVEQIVRSMARSSVRDFSRALHESVAGARPSPKAARTVLWLTPAERERVERDLRALAARHRGRKPGGARQPFVLMTLLATLEDRHGAAEGDGRSR